MPSEYVQRQVRGDARLGRAPSRRWPRAVLDGDEVGIVSVENGCGPSTPRLSLAFCGNGRSGRECLNGLNRLAYALNHTALGVPTVDVGGQVPGRPGATHLAIGADGATEANALQVDFERVGRTHHNPPTPCSDGRLVQRSRCPSALVPVVAERRTADSLARSSEVRRVEGDAALG